jgi:uncharacterized protein (TIGR03437 family)
MATMNSNSHFSLVSTTLLVCLLASAPAAHAQQPGWSVTGSLKTPRLSGHTATLLANGKVLVVGGSIPLANVSPYWRGTGSAELYDPATGQWSATGSLNSPRGGHFAVRLTNGRVLVVGGDNGYGILVRGAEIYDPETGAWTTAGNLSVERAAATATLLADGRVLVAGGADSNWEPVSSAELYNPATGVWSPAGSMISARYSHVATLLADNRVLVFAGYLGNGLRSAELYDPATGSWRITSDPVAAPVYTTGTLLPNGKVLVIGGASDEDDRCSGVDNAELYDPLTEVWQPTGSLNVGRAYSTVTVLPNAKVLVAAGLDSACRPIDSAELYDPVIGNWSATGSLHAVRAGHTATLLANGQVLVVGGDSAGTSAELFENSTPRVTSVSAASFSADRMLAPESIASAFGKNLAITTQTAGSLPRPTVLAGVSVVVRDLVGAQRFAPLLYASPDLINYVVPRGTAVGLATVTVTRGGSNVAAGSTEIARVAPGLFTANSAGRGVAAGFWTRVTAGGAQSQNYLFDLITHESVPVDLGAPGDQLFLSLYGTGFRAGTSATATVGGGGVPLSSFGVAADYEGVDVVTVGPLPRTLEGRGEVDVAVSVDGKAANLVKVNIR